MYLKTKCSIIFGLFNRKRGLQLPKQGVRNITAFLYDEIEKFFNCGLEESSYCFGVSGGGGEEKSLLRLAWISSLSFIVNIEVFPCSLLSNVNDGCQIRTPTSVRTTTYVLCLHLYPFRKWELLLGTRQGSPFLRKGDQIEFPTPVRNSGSSQPSIAHCAPVIISRFS